MLRPSHDTRHALGSWRSNGFKMVPTPYQIWSRKQRIRCAEKKQMPTLAEALSCRSKFKDRRALAPSDQSWRNEQIWLAFIYLIIYLFWLLCVWTSSRFAMVISFNEWFPLLETGVQMSPHGGIEGGPAPTLVEPSVLPAMLLATRCWSWNCHHWKAPRNKQTNGQVAMLEFQYSNKRIYIVYYIFILFLLLLLLLLSLLLLLYISL